MISILRLSNRMMQERFPATVRAYIYDFRKADVKMIFLES